MQATYTRIFRCHFYFLQTNTAIINCRQYVGYIHYSDLRPKRSKILMQQIMGLYIPQRTYVCTRTVKSGQKALFFRFSFSCLFYALYVVKMEKKRFFGKKRFYAILTLYSSSVNLANFRTVGSAHLCTIIFINVIDVALY